MKSSHCLSLATSLLLNLMLTSADSCPIYTSTKADIELQQCRRGCLEAYSKQDYAETDRLLLQMATNEFRSFYFQSEILNARASLCLLQGRCEEADKIMAASLVNCEAGRTGGNPENSDDERVIEKLLQREREYSDSEPFLAVALKLVASASETHPWWLSPSFVGLGRLYMHVGEFTSAERMFQLAIKTGANDDERHLACTTYAQLLEKEGRTNEARQMRRKAKTDRG